MISMSKNEEVEIDEQEGKINFKNEIFQWIKSLVISVIIIALIFTFVGRVLSVKGSSMVPTFHEGDRIITTNLHGDLKYGDVVVIKRKNDTPLIKRIIAVGGDTVDINIITGEVKVNNKVLEEPYINEMTHENHGVQYPVTVPEGHYFVMGDNRNYSDDSRNPKIGMIDEKNIFGKVIFRLFPFSKMGTIKFK